MCSWLLVNLSAADHLLFMLHIIDEFHSTNLNLFFFFCLSNGTKDQKVSMGKKKELIHPKRWDVTLIILMAMSNIWLSYSSNNGRWDRTGNSDLHLIQDWSEVLLLLLLYLLLLPGKLKHRIFWRSRKNSMIFFQQVVQHESDNTPGFPSFFSLQTHFKIIWGD